MAEFEGPAHEIGYAPGPKVEPARHQPTAAEKATSAAAVASNVENAWTIVLTGIEAMGAASAARDPEAWQRAHTAAESGLASLKDLAKAAKERARDATDATVRKKLEQVDQLLDAARKDLEAAPPAPAPVAPVLACESVLLAALPPEKPPPGPVGPLFDAARSNVERIIRGQMPYSDFAAFEKMLAEHPTSPIAIRFRRFGATTQRHLLGVLHDGKVIAAARAREAASQRTLSVAPPPAFQHARPSPVTAPIRDANTAELRTEVVATGSTAVQAPRPPEQLAVQPDAGTPSSQSNAATRRSPANTSIFGNAVHAIVSAEQQAELAHSAATTAFYLSMQRVHAWRAIGKYVWGLAWPQVSERLEWAEDKFTKQLLEHLEGTSPDLEPAALTPLLYPHDVYETIAPYVPIHAAREWAPAIGLVLGQTFADVLIPSVRRMTKRYVDVADAMQAADPTGNIVVPLDQLVTSHPMDRCVARALVTPGVAQVAPDGDVIVGKRKPPRTGLRPVKITWEGERTHNPKLWNAVRVSPEDASPEEVAATLFGYARDGHGDATSYYAYGLASAGPLHVLPASWAIQFPDARASAPEAIKEGHLPDPASDTIAARLATLASTDSADAIALAEATRDSRAAHMARGQVADTFNDCTIQLDHLRALLAPWGLAGELVAEIGYVVAKEDALAHAPADQVTAWASVALGQRDRLSEIGKSVQSVLDAAGPIAKKPRDKSAAPLRAILALLAEAAATSHLKSTSDQIYAEAMQEQASLSLRALQANMVELKSAVGYAELVRDSDAENRDRARPYEDTEDEGQQLVNRLLSGGEVDPAELQRVQLDAQTMALEARIAAIQAQLDQIAEIAIQTRAGLMSHIVANSTFKNLPQASMYIHGQLGEIEIDLHADTKQAAQAPGAPEPGGLSPALAARQAAVARAQKRFQDLYENKNLATFFKTAYDTVKSQQLRTAIWQAIAMIGFSIATGAVAGAVEKGLTAGYLTAEGAEKVGELSLGARAAIQVGKMGTEIVGNSIGQTVTTAGQPGAGGFTDALVDNTIFTLGTEATTGKIARDVGEAKAFEKSLDEQLARIDSQEARAATATTALQKTGRIALWPIKQAGTITAHAIMGMALGAVAERVHHAPHAGGTDSAELQSFLIQGASVAVGKLVHGAMSEVLPRLKQLAGRHDLAGGPKLLADAQHLQQLAAKLIAKPDAQRTIELLHERTRVLQAEIDVLDELAARDASGGGPSRSEIAQMRADLQGQLADARSQAMLEVSWHLLGLYELAPGVWKGDARQLASALDEARTGGHRVDPLPQQGDGVTRVTIDGKPFELHPSTNSAVPAATDAGHGPAPPPDARDRGGPARTPYGDVWPGEVPSRVPKEQREIFEKAKEIYDGFVKDRFQSASLGRAAWAKYLVDHGIAVEGVRDGGVHEVYEHAVVPERAPAPSDLALPRAPEMGARSHNTGHVTREACISALHELLTRGSMFAGARDAGNGVLHVQRADGTTWTITIVEPRPTATDEMAALVHGEHGDTVWVSDTLTNEEVPRALGAILGESLSRAGRGSAESAGFGELDAMFAHREAVAEAPRPAAPGPDATPVEIKRHAATASRAESTARIDAEIDLALVRMGLSDPGPTRDQKLAEMPPSLATKVRARLEHTAGFEFHAAGAIGDAAVAKPREMPTTTLATSEVFADAPTHVRAYSAADHMLVMELRVELETIKEIDARVALRDQPGTSRGSDIARGETRRRAQHVARARELMEQLQIGGGDTAYLEARLRELAAVFPGVEADVVPAIQDRIERRANAEAEHGEAEAFRRERLQQQKTLQDAVVGQHPFTTKRIIIGDGMSAIADVATLGVKRNGTWIDPHEVLVIGKPDLLAQLDPAAMFGQRGAVFDRAHAAHPAFSDANGAGTGALMRAIEDPGEFAHVGELRDANDMARKRLGMAALPADTDVVETTKDKRPDTPPWEVDPQQYPVRVRATIGGAEHYIYAEYTDITAGPGRPRMPNEQILSAKDRATLMDPEKGGVLFSGEKLLQLQKDVRGKRVLVMAFGPTGGWTAKAAASAGAARVDFAGSAGGELGSGTRTGGPGSEKQPPKEQTPGNDQSLKGLNEIDRLQDVLDGQANVHITLDRIMHIEPGPDGGALVTYVHGAGENAEVYQVHYDAIAMTMGYDQMAPAFVDPNDAAKRLPGMDPTVKDMVGGMRMVPQRGTEAPVIEDSATGRVRIMGIAGFDQTNVSKAEDPETKTSDADILNARNERLAGRVSADSPNAGVLEPAGLAVRGANRQRKKP